MITLEGVAWFKVEFHFFVHSTPIGHCSTDPHLTASVELPFPPYRGLRVETRTPTSENDFTNGWSALIPFDDDEVEINYSLESTSFVVWLSSLPYDRSTPIEEIVAEYVEQGWKVIER